MNLEKRYAKFILKKQYYTEKKYEKILGMAIPTVMGLVINYFNAAVLDYNPRYILVVPLFILFMLRISLMVRENPKRALKSYNLIFSNYNWVLIVLMIAMILIL